MKTFICTLLICLSVYYVGYSQSTNENYIFSRTFQIETNDGDVADNDRIETITYFDGLGRPKQTIGIRAGGDMEDLVTPVEYDAFGRQVKEYLPYATASQNGQIMPNPLTDVTSFYNTEKYENTPNPYSEKSMEASPLNRVLEQGAPGAPWTLGGGHGIEYAYQANATNEVRLLEVTFQNGDYRMPELTERGYYEAGSLYKTVTYDEENSNKGKNHSTEEFKDKEGRVVLKRTYADFDDQSEVRHDTYYVYDDYGNLTYVLPPKMEATAAPLSTLTDLLPDLGYQYEYDHRNRLAEKQLPGKKREYIVYNILDQPILTQDALQRSSNEWLYTKYDGLGRVVQTGIYSHGTFLDQEGMQGVVAAHEAGDLAYETKSGTTYTNQSFPTSNKEMLTENYYDSYAFDHTGITIPGENAYGLTIVSDKIQGLATGSRVKVLETSNWITTVNGYDDIGRSIWNATKNDFLETTDIVESELNFVGNTLRQTTTHQKSDVPEDIITEDIFTYDHMNRLLTHNQTINGGPEELIAHNTYDELGQLVKKGVGGKITLGEDFTTTYTDLINCEVLVDGRIRKTLYDSDWNASLNTEQNFEGDGSVSFTPETDNKLFRVGLTYTDPNNPDASYNYFAYVVRDYIKVNEGGNNLYHKMPYHVSVLPGDELTIERIGAKVVYKKNGVIYYTSKKESYGEMRGTARLYKPGICINYMEIKDLDTENTLQEINYAYNIRGWLKSINNPDDLEEDLFGFKIGYNNPEIPGATPLFNGNISETQWNSQSTNSTSNSVSKHYTYRYDALNRITSATDNTGHYNLSGIGYDKMGNILSLQRQGPIDDQITSFGVMDNLAYNYNGSNQLMQVADASLETQGFNDGNSGIDYGYDVNGNLTSDLNKGILAGGIKYNHLNLPTEVKFNNSSSQVIKYTYDATGVKLRKEFPGKITDYAGNFIYEGGTLQFFSTPEGYVSYDNGQFNYVYNYVDHLGNLRLSYTDGDGNGSIDPATEIIQEKDYYPFGLTHQGYGGAGGGIAYGNDAAKRYGFGGKELQDENFSGNTLDWYDISARNYDPALGRWMNIDPLAEQMRRHSPYNYAFDNPIFFIDPDGMKPCPNGDCPEGFSVIPIAETKPFTPSASSYNLVEEGKQIIKDAFNFDYDAEIKFAGVGGKINAGSVKLEGEIKVASVDLESDGSNVKATGKAGSFSLKGTIGPENKDSSIQGEIGYTYAEGEVNVDRDLNVTTQEGEGGGYAEGTMGKGETEVTISDLSTVGVKAKTPLGNVGGSVNMYEVAQGAKKMIQGYAGWFSDYVSHALE